MEEQDWSKELGRLMTLHELSEGENGALYEVVAQPDRLQLLRALVSGLAGGSPQNARQDFVDRLVKFISHHEDLFINEDVAPEGPEETAIALNIYTNRLLRPVNNPYTRLDMLSDPKGAVLLQPLAPLDHIIETARKSAESLIPTYKAEQEQKAAQKAERQAQQDAQRCAAEEQARQQARLHAQEEARKAAEWDAGRPQREAAEREHQRKLQAEREAAAALEAKREAERVAQEKREAEEREAERQVRPKPKASDDDGPSGPGM